MFVTYDTSSFPLVRVIFGQNIENDSDLDVFFNKWHKLYQDKKPFTFLLDTSKCGNIPVKYCYQIAKQVSNIKKLETQYLQKTIVLIESKWIKNLMKIYFTIMKPISPVYIVKNNSDAESLYFRLHNNLLKSDIDYDFINNK